MGRALLSEYERNVFFFCARRKLNTTFSTSLGVASFAVYGLITRQPDLD